MRKKELLNVCDTPLVKFEKISKKLKTNVYGKIETGNPTGSHKDRETLEILSVLKRKGCKMVGCASTGNAAISLAAYSRMAGVACHIYISKTISQERMNLIKMFSPQIHVLQGGYREAVEQSNLEMGGKGIYNANPGVCYSKIIGDSAIGKEIAEKIRPDSVVVPTNNGTLFTGVWNGLKASNVTPVMVAATAENTEIADSIKGFHRIEEPAFSAALEEANGIVVDTTDPAIEKANRLLFTEGIIAEPASAASIAALNKIESKRDEVVICVITGSGMKFPCALQDQFTTGTCKRRSFQAE
ncbi:MAG: pyridoxal-phosphate dependent enzyme [Candidatus Bathyarchaeota archaeon]|nr:pyridoxal-phosphate dependent enzyme [Candidatus Bathyarchaeota archaeon]